jgi:hypothetical protein
MGTVDDEFDETGGHVQEKINDLTIVDGLKKCGSCPKPSDASADSITKSIVNRC